MRTNPVKAALEAGKTVIGSEVSRLSSRDIPKIYALAGFEFAFLDMEHTRFSLDTVTDMIEASRAAGIVPLVRVPQAEYAYVARALDAGAQGLIVPRVNTPQQVRDLVSWTHYPPHGTRGFAGTIAQTEWENVSPADFIEHNNRETLLVIQIERQEALDNLDEMLSIPGVDVACLGYMDLSIDLGVPGEVEHPKMDAALQQVVNVAELNGIAAGIIGGEMRIITNWLNRGMRFASYGTEILHLQSATRRAVDELRAGIE